MCWPSVLFSGAASSSRVDCCFFASRCLLLAFLLSGFWWQAIRQTAWCAPPCPRNRQAHSQTNRESDCWTDKAGHAGIKERSLFCECCFQHVFISSCTHVEPCGRTRKCKYIPQADLGVSWRRVAERLCWEFESIAGCACMNHTLIPFIGIANFTDTFALLDQSLC